jgi:DNA-binding NtrC family response regulator
LARSMMAGLQNGERLQRHFTPAVMERLMRHPFPGNVRELRNVLERAATLDTDPTEMLTPLGVAPAPVALPPAQAPIENDDAAPGRFLELRADCDVPFKEAKERLLESFEAAYFVHLIKRAQGNASAMARIAGIDRKHIYNLAKKHNVALRQRADEPDGD